MHDRDRLDRPRDTGRAAPRRRSEPELGLHQSLLRTQQSAGNAAVRSLLQRTPNPELESMTEPVPVTRPSQAQQDGAPAPPADEKGAQETESVWGWMKKKMNIGHASGKQVDEYVNASPFIKKYVEDKVKGGTKAEGHVHVHTAEEFKKEYVKYAQTRGSTEEQAIADEPDVNAFRDGSEIHVHEDRGQFATTIHESMHLFSHDDYRGKLGVNANEGATEYFTRKICKEQGVKRDDYYSEQHASTKKLAELVGEDKLAAAYYQGKIDELGTAVDGAKAAGTWDQWVAKMKAGSYDDADALL